ncbi:hypothetical protein EC988_006117 [Linderina pennispora]|nr:hypothetical protein EC988_006117 [Linderina pennispora]
MLLFNIGSDSGSSTIMDGTIDDSKPNSIYGDSALDSSLIALQDLSPSTVPVNDDDDASALEDLEDDIYVLEDATAVAHDLFPAECCVERASSSRREKYYFTMGKKFGLGELSRRTAGLQRRSRQPTVAAAKYRHELAIKAANDLQRELFPVGVPSQGVLKSGVDADVQFRAIGCERPWHGFIIDDVLYVYVSEFYGDEHSFRNAVMALMELAEDVLMCASVIVALPKALTPLSNNGISHQDTLAAASLVRAFLYSGFEMVSPLLYQPSPSYVLVGYDAM